MVLLLLVLLLLLLLLFGDGSDMNCVYVFAMCVLLVFNAAVQSKGYSGAEIASICREAALNAIEEDENAAVVKTGAFHDRFGQHCAPNHTQHVVVLRTIWFFQQVKIG